MRHSGSGELGSAAKSYPNSNVSSLAILEAIRGTRTVEDAHQAM